MLFMSALLRFLISGREEAFRILRFPLLYVVKTQRFISSVGRCSSHKAQLARPCVSLFSLTRHILHNTPLFRSMKTRVNFLRVRFNPTRVFFIILLDTCHAILFIYLLLLFLYYLLMLWDNYIYLYRLSNTLDKKINNIN